MTNQDKELVKSFEAKLRHLLFLYEKVKKENIKLQELLEDEKKKTLELENKYRSLHGDYTHLKTALIINPNRKDIKDTKDRLSKLVREVDKCIALLNI
ncbi:hypothetical protein Bcop_0848 [Bacteroides coprosuis DSM 18011]|uniref:Uncharacterized protein n=1 Tax=Bacteroides coprosuis DSM 18011 TaxID=679937 RepID=F3ZTH1_9BACE|nr:MULTISPECIES: hypothetical protein [Bacteroides]EGJ71061.1 hypothetical protein Bcop_0848 [Bacteroides coprosuis DSM 18011]HJD92088.1 hypothetical protein [Bacteroides coprosuis]